MGNIKGKRNFKHIQNHAAYVVSPGLLSTHVMQYPMILLGSSGPDQTA